jgi:hypothetical protein
MAPVWPIGHGIEIRRVKMGSVRLADADVFLGLVNP